jgi:hypothetical protein
MTQEASKEFLFCPCSIGLLLDRKIEGMLFLPAALGPGVCSVSNTNEYQKH